MRDEPPHEWAITEIVALTGTTSRTLRHYDDIGLLTPSRIGTNGYRYYDRDALVRLQRILLLRQLGLGLTTIGGVLAREVDVAAALETHLGSLRAEQDRVARQLASVERTLEAIRQGRELDMAEMFDGFDNTQYKDEVEQRWGADAYSRGASWWGAKSADEKQQWQRAQTERTRTWVELAATDASPAGPAAQKLAADHVAWLRSVPGTPAASGGADALRQYVLGLADMYVSDERFAANYGGERGAAFVRAALQHYIATHPS